MSLRERSHPTSGRFLCSTRVPFAVIVLAATTLAMQRGPDASVGAPAPVRAVAAEAPRTWSGRLVDDAGRPMAKARMCELATGADATTDDQGRFALVLPPPDSNAAAFPADRAPLVEVNRRLVELPPAHDARALELGHVRLATAPLDRPGPFAEMSDEELRLRLREAHTRLPEPTDTPLWLEATRRGGSRWAAAITAMRAETTESWRRTRGAAHDFERNLAEASFDTVVTNPGTRPAPLVVRPIAVPSALDPEESLAFEVNLDVGEDAAGDWSDCLRSAHWRSLLAPGRWSFEVRALDVTTGEAGPPFVLAANEFHATETGDPSAPSASTTSTKSAQGPTSATSSTRRRVRVRLDWPFPGAFRIAARVRSTSNAGAWPGAPSGSLVAIPTVDVVVRARTIEVAPEQDQAARAALARLSLERPALLLERSWREGFRGGAACDPDEEVLAIGWAALPALFDALDADAPRAMRAHQFALLFDVTGIDDPRDTPGTLGHHRVVTAGAESWSLRCEPAIPSHAVAWDDAAIERLRARWLARRAWYDVRPARGR